MCEIINTIALIYQDENGHGCSTDHITKGLRLYQIIQSPWYKWKVIASYMNVISSCFFQYFSQDTHMPIGILYRLIQEQSQWEVKKQQATRTIALFGTQQKNIINCLSGCYILYIIQFSIIAQENKYVGCHSTTTNMCKYTHSHNLIIATLPHNQKINQLITSTEEYIRLYMWYALCNPQR